MPAHVRWIYPSSIATLGSMRTLSFRGWKTGLLAGSLMLAGCDQNAERLDPNKPVPPGPPPLAQQLGHSTTSEPRAPVADRGIPPGITGEITLAPELEGKIGANAVLFVFARPLAGGPPLAARRFVQPHFPLKFFLGQESLMTEGRALEGPVDIMARVAQNGVAGGAQAGDLSGACPDNPVIVGNSTVYSIRIDKIEG